MKRPSSGRSGRHGVTIIWTLIILGTISAMLAALAGQVLTGRRLVERHEQQTQALWLARIFHVSMVAALIALVISFHLGVLSFIGILAVAVLLVYEHGLVKPDDLSRVNAAFFTVNGYVSVLFFIFWAADILLHRAAA